MNRPLALLALLVIGGCGGRAVVDRPVTTAGDAVVFVYLAGSFAPQGGEEVDASSVELVRIDGTPSTLPARRLSRRSTVTPRLFAAGRVASGKYRGIRVSFAESPAETGRVEEISIPFDVAVGQGRVVLLKVSPSRPADLEASVDDGDVGTVGVESSAKVLVIPPLPVLGVVPSSAAEAALIFDRTTGEPVGAVPTGRDPVDVAVDPIAGRAFVAARGGDAVDIVELATANTVGRVSLAFGDGPTALAVTPDGNTVVTANRGSSSLSLVDVVARVERRRIPLQDRPLSLVLSSDGRLAYVLLNVGGVAVVDLAAGRVTASIPVETGPVRLRYDGNRGRLYVAHAAGRSVIAIDAATQTVVRRIALDFPAADFVLDGRTGRVYVATRGGPGIAAYDPGSPLPAVVFPTTEAADFLELDPEGNALCIVLRARGELRLQRLVGGQVFGRFETGVGPGEPAFSGSR